MTSELSTFAARVREFIHSAAGRFGSAAGCPDEEDAFRSLAFELFRLQFTYNAAYRTICRKRGVTTLRVSHWQDIPAVPTAAFKEFDLTSIPPEQRTRAFHSSGTTARRPSRHFHCRDSLALYEASLLPWFRVHIERRGQLMILTPPPAEAPHSSLAYMMEVIRQDSRAPESAFAGRVAEDGTWVVDVARVRRQLEAACEGETRWVLLGTAFSLVQLLDDLAERNLCLRFPKGSRVFETGGYKGRVRNLPKPAFYRLIQDRLGVRRSHILSEYGMSELGSQAYDSALSAGEPESAREASISRSFEFPPWARAVVISPETGREVADGETGLLRVYDLANVWSVMAIQTEDLAVRRGDGFEFIGRAEPAEPRGCSLLSADRQPATHNS